MQGMPCSKNRNIYFLQHPDPKIQTNEKAAGNQQSSQIRSVKEQQLLQEFPTIILIFCLKYYFWSPEVIW